MQFKFSRKTWLRISRLLKWSRVIAKFAAIGTTLGGAVSAITGSATTGMALSAAGATTYAASSGLRTQSWEKTRHVPPGRFDKAANLRSAREMDAFIARKKSGNLAASRPPMPRTLSNTPHVSARHTTLRTK